MTQINDLFPSTGAAFVAGGSGGIGSVISRRLAASGVEVYLTYNRNRDKADAVVSEIKAAGGRAHALPLQLENDAMVKSTIDEVAKAAGGLHTVVYSVGPFVPFKFISQMTSEQVKEFLNTDTLACFNLMHAALPHLREAKGSALAITSTAVDRWSNRDGLSAIPKAAVNMLMRGIAREEGRFGVRANMVALGIIRAGMFNKSMEEGHLNEEYLTAMAKNVPLQRTGTAQEVAEAVHFLTSNLASYTTGQTIYVDGGYVA